MNIKIYQKLCAESKILWTQHCLQRMQERDISRLDVKNGIATGEIIEDYPDDYPNPSCLIFGYNVNGHILHIVAGCDNINIYIITAYYPDTKNEYSYAAEPPVQFRLSHLSRRSEPL